MKVSKLQDDSLAEAVQGPASAPQARAKAGPCPCCGRHAVRPTAQPGRVCRYRNTALTLPADLLVPTCRRCKHLLLSFDSTPELAAVFDEVREAFARVLAHDNAPPVDLDYLTSACIAIARELGDKMLERRPVDTAGAADFAVKLILGGVPALPKL